MATVPPLTPEAEALLNAIASTESGGDWNVIYGGQKFNDYSAHPGVYVTIKSGPNQGKKSSAAGKYQITKTTYDRVAPKLGITDFSPESQKQIAWYLANEDYGPGLQQALESGDPATIKQIGTRLASTWTSLPSGIEATTTGGKFLNAYNTALASPPADATPNLGALDPRIMDVLGYTNSLPALPEFPSNPQYEPLPAPAPLQPGQIGTPPGTPLNLTANGTVTAPSGAQYRVGQVIPSADGQRSLRVTDQGNGVAGFEQIRSPFDIPGVINVGRESNAPTIAGGYIRNALQNIPKPDVGGAVQQAASTASTAASGALEKGKEAAAGFGNSLLGSVGNLFKGNSNPPVPPKNIPDVPTYRVSPQNMGITPPPVSRAPVAVPKPSPQPTQAQLQAMRAVPPAPISTPPLAPGLTAQQKYAMSALPPAPAIPPMPTSPGPTQAQLQAMRAVGPSAYLMPTNYMPPSVPPSIVPTPTLEPNMLQKIAAQTTVGKVVNALSGGGPQVNDPNEAMRRNIRPITYNFAPVKAAGQAYDVMGRDLAFMPKSVQTSSRWNTGY